MSTEQESVSSNEVAPATPATPPASPWQAIFAPQYNTYYFYNTLTQETTWINPLEQQQQQPEASTSSSATPASVTEHTQIQVQNENENENEQEQDATAAAAQATTASAVSARHAALQAAALAQGIDPLLAHLDPSLLASPSVPGSSGGTSDLPSFTAKFNSRTGQFTPASARTPGHLSEHERAKRMSEFYFDVGKWEEDLARRGGRLMGEEDAADGGYEEGTREKKRKRPSKKDLDRFKERKRLKKIAKTAWLRT